MEKEINNFINEKNYKSLIHNFKVNTGLDFTNNTIFRKSKKSRNYNMYQTKSGSISDNCVLSHLKHENTYALKKFPYTTTYTIDIDSNSQYNEYWHKNIPKLIKEIVKLIGEPFFIEKNENKDNYHLYYKFNKLITKQSWDFFKDYILQSLGAVIETPFYWKQMRLPLSKDYYKNSGKYNENVPNLILRNRNKSLLHKINFFSNIKYKEIPQLLFIHNGKNIEVVKNKTLLSKNFPEAFREDFTYGNGTRHQTQIALAFKDLRERKSLDEFIKNCEYWNDGTSKDMKLNINKRNKIITSIYKWCKSKVKYDAFDSNEEYVSDWNNTNNIFYANEDYVLSEDLNNAYDILLDQTIFIEYTLERGIRQYIPQHRIDFKNDCKIILTFIHSMLDYRQKNNYEYKKERFKFLNDGVPFSIDIQRKLFKHYKIKNSREIMKFLKKYGFLNEIKDENGYSYSYKRDRFVKHFKTFSNIFDNKFIKKVSKFLNSVVKHNKVIIVNFYRKLKNDINNNITYNYLLDLYSKVTFKRLRNNISYVILWLISIIPNIDDFIE